MLQAAVEEFEQVLEQVHSKGVEDEEVAQKANKVSSAARALRAKNRTPGQWVMMIEIMMITTRMMTTTKSIVVIVVIGVVVAVVVVIALSHN